jgi:hypothetical protein
MKPDYLKTFERLSGIKNLITENSQLDLVKRIVAFLNANYQPGETNIVTVDGRVSTKKVIGVKSKDNSNKNIIATQISPLDVFYRVEDEFKNDIDKSEKRTIFLKQCVIDWFNGYDGLKNGILSKNLAV